MVVKMEGGFLQNLGRIYAIYTGVFLAFTVLIGILEQLGVPNRFLGYMYVFGTLMVYAVIGILSRTGQLTEYYVAGRSVPAFYNGMATASDWMSAASFIGMAGSLYLGGFDSHAFIIGWTGGYVLVAVLMAPYLRKFGQYTVPDFFGARYGGNVARLIAVLVLITASFVYMVAQLVGVGIIASRFLALQFEVAVFAGLVGILVCSMMGGMKAVTWTQVAQYIILIVAYLIPVTILSAQVTGVPVPQLMYGQAVEKMEALEKTLGILNSHVNPFSNARGEYEFLRMLNFLALTLCLMVGTASLPHILMRYFTTPTVREARQSVGWSIFFIYLLYFTAPAYAVFAKLEVYQNVIGQPIAQLPAWVAEWGKVGLVVVNDANRDGILQLAEFRIQQDAIVLATPEIAGLPYVIAGLVAAGGLAAALSTADGLLLAMSNAMSHDVYYKMIDPKADTAKRMLISRVLLVVLALLGAWVAGQLGADILFLVAWAFSIAASGLFAGLVLGVWWKGTSTAGAVAGMLAGFGTCMFLLLMSEFNGPQLKVWLDAIAPGSSIANLRGRQVCNFWGISSISVGVFGIPISFLTTIIVSKLTTPPPKEMQDFIDSIRIPTGEVKMASGEAPAH
ncbi:MAG: cation acetate symporter [Magnetospirillum sp.]|jgi:cation/acetate symporter|nr:cation acetate symporter [Magnetospirillum sp.]